MSTRPIRPPVIDDVDDKNQRATRTAILQLTKDKTNTVTVTLSGTTLLVQHRLGRPPDGWFVVDKTAQADIWRDATVATTKDFIPLKASGAVTATIQFFVS